MKRRKLTAAENRATLGAFLPPTADELPVDGCEVLLPYTSRKLSVVARLNSLRMSKPGSTDADAEKVKQADEKRASEKPPAGPTWITNKPEQRQ